MVSIRAGAQTDFWKSSNAYFGQKPPGDIPQKFSAPHLNDSGYFVLGRIAFSADGKEFYFGTNNRWFNDENQSLKCYRFEGGQWKGPFMLLRYYSTPTFSPDGQSLYVAARGVERMQRTKDGWTDPAPYLMRSYALYNFMSTNSGHSYVGSNGTWGKIDDYSSWQFAILPTDLSDTSIQSLGTPLNSPGFNGDLYIAPDESYMIISAKETKDFECELWISFRKADKSWTIPISLGAAINEGAAHRFGQYVSPDGKYLFYTKGTSEKDCALYWVRFDGLLKALKKQSL